MIKSCQSSLASQFQRLNNLLAFTSIGVSGGFRQLPLPSNVAITGRVYHQLHDVTERSQSLKWFLYDEQGHDSLRVRLRDDIPSYFHDENEEGLTTNIVYEDLLISDSDIFNY